LMPREKAWFQEGEILGIVLEDQIDFDWSWVCLAKHPDRGWRYRAIDAAASLSSFEKAKEALAATMRKEASAWSRWRDVMNNDPEPD